MKKNGEFKVLYLIISVLVTLGLFLGGYNLYGKYLVEKPLVEKLTNIEEVQSVDISKKEKVYIIKLNLARVDNIQDSYTSFDSAVSNVIKQGNYKIEIEDNRSLKLDKLLDDLQPSIYQGLAQKQYLWLDEQIKQLSEDKGVAPCLFVDEKRIYLQMIDDNSYLYHVIEYQDNEEQQTGRSGVN